MSTLSAKEYKCFEDIKRVRPDGSEYWAARELAPVLDYAKWENFYKVIKRAMIACENSGRSTLECFPEVRKTSPMPNGGVKDILDYELSRYACYLIVQNGDPRKEVIALGQTYFAIQTYRQEVADRFNQLDEDSRRLVVRGDIKQWNQLLAETAQNAGVITAEEFAIFQNAGYMGLYHYSYRAEPRHHRRLSWSGLPRHVDLFGHAFRYISYYQGHRQIYRKGQQRSCVRLDYRRAAYRRRSVRSAQCCRSYCKLSGLSSHTATEYFAGGGWTRLCFSA